MNQRILITGAASGLGLALARRYAAAGWRVLLTDVDREGLAAAVASFGENERIHGLVLDVQSDADWIVAREVCVSQWGGLDVLVNNAGVATGGRFARTPMDDWDWILDINLKGVIRGCRTFIPVFEEQGHGQIVNVASLAGLLNPPLMSSYNVVKSAVVALSETLRFELEPAGITTSVVCPSFFRTGLAARFRTPDPAMRDLLEHLVTASKVPAEEIAATIERGITAKRFLILTDRDGRVSYFVKRFAPPLFRHQARSGTNRLLDRIAKSEGAASGVGGSPGAAASAVGAVRTKRAGSLSRRRGPHRLLEAAAAAPAERIADGVWILRGGLTRAMNVFLIETPEGAVVFDAGEKGMVDAIERAAAPLGGIACVVLGHGDTDHRGAAPGLAAKGHPILCHADAVPYAEGDGGREYWRPALLPAGVRRFHALMHRFFWDGGPVSISDTVSEGDDIGGFEVVELPGHAPGLIGLWRKSDGLALVSDCFYMTDMWGHDQEPSVPLEAYNFDTAQAREAIHKLASLKPVVVWPGHRGPLQGSDVVERLERAAAS